MIPGITLRHRSAVALLTLLVLFTTGNVPLSAQQADSTLSFLVIGDWGYKGENAQRAVAERMGVVAGETGSRFVVTTGDNFYYDGVAGIDDPHWRASFEDVYTAPSLQRPWYVTLGNHDYNGSIDAQLAYARSSERWTLPARYHTAVHAIDDSTTVRFLFLDTEILDSANARQAGIDPGQQLAWLDSVLESSTAQWHVAVGHRPMYTGSRAGNSAELIGTLRPVFDRHDVQVYIAGHDHDLQHLRPAGSIDYFISGAGGKPRDSGTSEHTLFNLGNTPGFMAVTLSASQMRVRFIDAEGNELYRTALLRHDIGRTATRDGAFPPSARPDRVIASWRHDPASSLSVTWRTEPGVRTPVGQIAVATSSPQFGAAASTRIADAQILETDDGVAQYNTVEFTDLAPGTLYAYRVGDGEVWSEWHQVRSAAATPEPFTFIYLGDAQNNILSHWPRTLRAAYARAPDAAFTVHAGDLVNRGSRDREWGEWFESAGWIHASVPVLPATGNHEHDRRDTDTDRLTRHWRAQFALPENGPAGLEESAYFVDYQGVRLVALNSTQAADGQTEWLERVLGDNPNRWTIVSFHHPIFSTARNRDNAGLRAAWKPLFERYGVDLVLTGHDHTYGRARSAPHADGAAGESGPVYVVSVSGPKMYRLGAGTEWMTRRAEDTQLYQIIRIDGDRLHFEAYTVTGELYDAFELVQRPGRENEVIETLPANQGERRHAVSEPQP